MRHIVVYVLLILSTGIINISLFNINLFAQSAGGEDERFFYGSNADEDFKIVSSDNSFSDRGIQYGAVISPIFLYEDNSGGTLSSYILNARVWGRIYLWNNAFFYMRVKNSYLGIITQDGDYESYESDNLLELDLAYISMPYQNMNFSVGRKYYTIGTGLVLNGRGDGAEAVWHSSLFSINLLGLYTGLLLKDDNPYRLSEKDISDGAKRMFSGGTVSAFFNNQKLYIFGLVQIDNANQTKGNEEKYDSRYYGTGLDGVLFGDLVYYAEFVYETGTSYISDPSSNKKSNISAFAVNSGVYYYVPPAINPFSAALNPALIFQYSFGSGDENRESYYSSNRPGGSGDDKGFIAFGTFAGGYALKPQLGNIHIIRGGFSFSPYRRMSVGSKYLYYLKDKKDAPINSGEADLPKSFIGQGVDVSFRWQIFYDLSMYVNYGLFLPGDAYDSGSNKTRNFFMAGVNLSM